MTQLSLFLGRFNSLRRNRLHRGFSDQSSMYPSNKNSISAFCVCSLFSASS